MSSQRRQAVMRDLVEEGKKRIVFLAICVVGLSYLMSLTSSSVWVNLPAAASLIVIIRYLSLDFEMRKKAAIYNSKPSSTNTLSHSKPLEYPKAVETSDWRRKVNSPVVEDAIDHFTKRLVSEWVTNLWYSRLTPDKEGPAELVQIINGVLGEISGRMKNINLISLLTRDLIHLICTHLELFRASQAKMQKQQSGSLTIEYLDMELRRILAAENKLHPALFSAEAEHKVLQHLMDGLISFTFKPEDLQCSFFRFVVRELLACAVMRPVLNLASPRFINERIEALVISRTKSGKVTTVAEEASLSKLNGSSSLSSDYFSNSQDPSVNGVELVQLKAVQSKSATNKLVSDDVNTSKDPLLSVDARSTRSFGSLPMNSHVSDGKGIIRHQSGGEWGDMLDLMSLRKTQALAPENFENMWAKGKNYKKKEDKLIEQVPQKSSIGKAVLTGPINSTSKPRGRDSWKNLPTVETLLTLNGKQISNSSSVASYSDNDEHNLRAFEEASSSSHTSEDDENSNVTGLGSPGTKVWDGKNNRNQAVAHIHHPLENFEDHNGRKTGKKRINHRSVTRTQPDKKSKSKLSNWQEIERTSFLSGDGLDILNSPAGYAKAEESSDESETENFGRVHSGAAASSSAASFSVSETRNLTVTSVKSSLSVDSFYKLKCEVLGANIVKSDSRTFAVYSISVTDVNNHSWSIKRRFRHFEELHRRLKEYPEYNLHLPPKHFLSTGLDVPIIRERCKLLDKYLKKLLQLPTISGSIEVWDFLCVDSQTYLFSNSFSILETLSVDLDDKSSEAYKVTNNVGSVINSQSPRRQYLGAENKGDGLRLDGKDISNLSVSKPRKEYADPEAMVQSNVSSLRHRVRTAKQQEHDALPETSELPLDSTTDQNLPTEWVPPNLTVPILDLVDVIFQLHDGGWIRRKAFWVAKQILHLGMGDAVDDWLIEKIQLLRKGPVLASGIQRLEQILWPDGIFVTKHPKRQRPPPSPSPSSPSNHKPEISSPRAVDEEQKLEADRRAKFVYELMIENAPAGIVSLVGRREYEQCAKDLYFFIQSSVCLKQLVFDLLELLLVSAFPEMDNVLKQLHEEKHRFGEFKSS